MSANASSSSFSESMIMHCLFFTPSSLIFTSLNITNIFLLLPLCIFILYHGLQQWRSTSSASTMSHSDSFTYHMVIMELTGILGYIISSFGIYKEDVTLIKTGFIFLTFTWYGEMYFHVLTCVERYLAVVHPITYMSLRKERGVRIRNICIGCVWVACFILNALMLKEEVFVITDFCLTILSLTVISFCSLSVLWVLMRSGPGEQLGRRERVDQPKLRAFYTIVVILAALVLRSAWSMLRLVMNVSGVNNCKITSWEVWVNLPSSLVLLLLFLHRKGTFVWCKSNIQ